VIFMALAEFIYTRLLRPAPVRRAANAILLSIVPETVRVGPAIVHLNPRDPVVSGALALRVFERDELNISGFCISQVAIKLPPRTYGHSKMRLRDIAYSVRVILQLAWRTRSNRTSMVYAAPRSGRDVAEEAQTDRAVTPPRCARQ
jgi:hypothetical protein